MLRKLISLASLLFVLGCAEQVQRQEAAPILLVGDSMFAMNKSTKGGVGDAIEAALGLQVIDRSVPGASYLLSTPGPGATGLNVTSQYRSGPWKVIVVNGGGNDLLFGCGCGSCAKVLDQLISADGTHGAIPEFVASLRKSGARVVYAGYMRNPGTFTPIKGCGPAGNELDRRLMLLDALDPGVDFVPMADLVPYGSTSYHKIDRIHPSRTGSREIGLRIARLIGPLLGRPPNTYVSPGD